MISNSSEILAETFKKFTSFQKKEVRLQPDKFVNKHIMQHYFGNKKHTKKSFLKGKVC